MVKLGDKIASLRNKMDSLKDAKVPTQEYADYSKELQKAEERQASLAKKTDELKAKLAAVETKEVPTEAYSALSNELEHVTLLLNSFAEEQKKLESQDVSRKFDELVQSEEEALRKIKELKQQLNLAIENKDVDSYKRVNTELEIAKSNFNDLRKKEEHFTGNLNAYDDVCKKVRQYTQEVQRLKSAMAELEQSGQAFSYETSPGEGKEYNKLNADLKKYNSQLGEANEKVNTLCNKMNELKDKGGAFTLGSDTDEFADLTQKLKYAENDMRALKAKHSELSEKQKDNSKQYKKLGNAAKNAFNKANDAAKKGGSAASKFGSRLKGILSSLLIFQWVTKAFNALIGAIKDGFTNIYNSSDSFKSKVDSLKASVETLKNALASAFLPLVEIAIPYIQRFIEWLTKALDLFAQFTAALTGQKTYTKAMKKTAEATEEAKEETENYLSPIDTLNRFQKQDSDSDKEEGAGGTDFVEVPIDSKVVDLIERLKNALAPILEYAKELKDVFKQGFMDGLGDFEPRLESIKKSLSSIKESLIDIFTDPNVLNAADGWAKSVAYMLGAFAGSVASIGLTIATNLLGGIAKYLEQNKDRIKGYLISMFNIWEDINLMLSEFFIAFAYVFEAFASEDGQQLTANIIGIFSSAFMGITELASKIARDVLNIFIQPFVDNKEKFRTALEGFLGVLSEVTGTIKKGIDDTFAKANEVYEQHIKPLFDSLAQGWSDLTSSFLDMWNNNVKPMLDEWAVKFDTLWREHLQPAIDSIIELFGSLGDALKAIWEKILLPIYTWLVEEVFPVLLPLFDVLYDTAVFCIGGMADYIKMIANVVKDVVDLVVALINGDWSAAWDSALKIVTDIWDGITGIIKGAYDLISGWINDILGWFSGVKDEANSMPTGSSALLGGSLSSPSSYSLLSNSDLPDFPGYATGQVIPRTMKKHLAYLGDNNRETEVVSPVSTMKQAFKEAMLEMNGSGNGKTIVYLYLDGQQITEAVVENGKVIQSSTGTNPFALA